VPHPEANDRHSGLAYSDEETLTLARSRASALHASLGDTYHFYAGAEGGLHSLEIDGSAHYFVRSWAVIVGVAGEAWGASGSIEIPGRLIEGLEGSQIPFSVPGTRRSGGMISSLTGRLETRRSATAEATFHALSTLFYGILESRPVRRR
jgi:non-canonical (house-cleaning) NTP pyrophosphatase